MASNDPMFSPRTLEQQKKPRQDTVSSSQHLERIAQHQMEESQPSKRLKTEPSGDTTNSNPRIKQEFHRASIKLKEMPRFQPPADGPTTSSKRQQSLYDVPEFIPNVPHAVNVYPNVPPAVNAQLKYLAGIMNRSAHPPNPHGFAPNFPVSVIGNGYQPYSVQQPIPPRPAPNVPAPAITNDRLQNSHQYPLLAQLPHGLAPSVPARISGIPIDLGLGLDTSFPFFVNIVTTFDGKIHPYPIHGDGHGVYAIVPTQPSAASARSLEMHIIQCNIRSGQGFLDAISRLIPQQDRNTVPQAIGNCHPIRAIMIVACWKGFHTLGSSTSAAKDEAGLVKIMDMIRLRGFVDHLVVNFKCTR
ncbi:hypothetical protein IFR05_010941 [Cadophora sp. M221]|nr:hypothetical protein IFR05_010941 [Cadophora sp. M221]